MVNAHGLPELLGLPEPLGLPLSRPLAGVRSCLIPTPSLVSLGCCHLKQAVGRGIPAGDRALASLEAQDADVSCAELEQPPSCGTESQPGAC